MEGVEGHEFQRWFGGILGKFFSVRDEDDFGRKKETNWKSYGVTLGGSNRYGDGLRKNGILGTFGRDLLQI